MQLLRILGFEILFKAALWANAAKPPRHHKYRELWADLPAPVQRDIMAVARAYSGNAADFTRLDDLLGDWQFVFEKARYYYELYEGQSREEQQRAGAEWIAAGAPAGTARVRYHPLELERLIEGLRTFVDRAIKCIDG